MATVVRAEVPAARTSEVEAARLVLPDRGRYELELVVGRVASSPDLLFCWWDSEPGPGATGVAEGTEGLVRTGQVDGAAVARALCRVEASTAGDVVLDDVTAAAVPVR